MTESEFDTELQVGLRLDPFCDTGNMLAALAFERCRQYINSLIQENKEDTTAKLPARHPEEKINELNERLPRGYRRIPHA